MCVCAIYNYIRNIFIILSKNEFMLCVNELKISSNLEKSKPICGLASTGSVLVSFSNNEPEQMRNIQLTSFHSHLPQTESFIGIYLGDNYHFCQSNCIPLRRFCHLERILRRICTPRIPRDMLHYCGTQLHWPTEKTNKFKKNSN